jgi:hypothetical protein
VTTRTLEEVFWLHPLLCSKLEPVNREARRVVAAKRARLRTRLERLVARANRRRPEKRDGRTSERKPQVGARQPEPDLQLALTATAASKLRSAGHHDEPTDDEERSRCRRPPRSAERRREPGLPSSRRDVMRSASA